MLSSTKAKICTTDKGPWYVSAVKKLPVKWVHETFGKRNVVERRFFPIKHRLKKFTRGFLETPGMRLSGAGLLVSLHSTRSWKLEVKS